MTRRTLIASLLFPFVLLLGSVSPALAECSPQDGPFPAMRFAFIAEVTEFAYGSGTGLDREWSAELDVERTFRGSLPARLSALGIGGRCGFHGIEVLTGERLFIAAEDVDPSDPSLIRGEIFVWREVTDGRWEFYDAALQDGALSFPAAVLDADTIEEILAVVGLRAPETATATPSAGERGLDPSVPFLAGVFGLSLLAVFVHAAGRGPERRAGEPRRVPGGDRPR